MSPPNSTIHVDSHRAHPIRPPDDLFDDTSLFTDPLIAPTHIHRSTSTPKYLRLQINLLRHSDTLRLQAPASHIDPAALYLNAEVINRTLEIIYDHSPYTDTRHFLLPAFLENILRPDNDMAIPRYNRRALTLQDGPSLQNTFLLVPFHITATHWTLLVRRNDDDKGTHTVSHDSLPMPLDFTDTITNLTYYDKLLKLQNGFTTVPTRPLPAVIQDNDFNYGICMLTTAVIYLYHPHPIHFPWYTLNYPHVLLHMHLVIISILATGKPPILVDILPPRSLSPHSPLPAHNTCVTQDTAHQPSILSSLSIHPLTRHPYPTLRRLLHGTLTGKHHTMAQF